VDNDYDLDVLVSCKRCPGGYLFRNDGAGKFTDVPGGLRSTRTTTSTS
jgi:hypothetical protein